MSGDAALFAALRALAWRHTADLRQGQMFGAPALFVGRRMAGCVLGGVVGLRVPPALAQSARQSGRAADFTPHGRPPMTEWIALALPPERLDEAADLIAAALDFAAANAAR